jgi:hypothetical protein
VRELETKDLFLPLRGRGRRSHAITTLFLVTVRGARVTLDGQSADWSWRSTGQWLARVRQPFVRSVLTKFRRGEYGQPS